MHAPILPSAPAEPQWVGSFSDDDRQQISSLRAAQARCVASGNVADYARLCTEDVASMLTGHDLVLGREAFIAFQTTLFQGASFPGLRKLPVRIERSGDLAVEIGRQMTETSAAQFATQQKYTHVMRRTAEGWRFCVLMSNNSLKSS